MSVKTQTRHGRSFDHESVNSLVGMDHSDPSVVALFQGQMRIERAGSSPALGLGGDSGSLVISRDDRRAVGLYFAGANNGIYRLASHIQDVLEQLEIELIV